jgi:hypothetical protein
MAPPVHFRHEIDRGHLVASTRARNSPADAQLAEEQGIGEADEKRFEVPSSVVSPTFSRSACPHDALSNIPVKSRRGRIDLARGRNAAHPETAASPPGRFRERRSKQLGMRRG